MFLMLSSDFFHRSIDIIGARVQRFVLSVQIHSERKPLRRLDDRLLQDIGVTRAEANREARRAFGDIPATRLQGRHSGDNPKDIAHPDPSNRGSCDCRFASTQ